MCYVEDIMLMDNVLCTVSLKRSQITWEIKINKEIIGALMEGATTL